MKTLAFALCAVLAGCATASGWQPEAKRLMAQGQCQAARNLAAANEPDLMHQTGLFGAIYADCDRNMTEAAKYFHLSARFGNQEAQRTLIQLGLPVPPADLAQRRQAGNGVLYNIVQGGYAAPDTSFAPSGSATCSARQTSMGAGMNRQYQITCR